MTVEATEQMPMTTIKARYITAEHLREAPCGSVAITGDRDVWTKPQGRQHWYRMTCPKTHDEWDQGSITSEMLSTEPYLAVLMPTPTNVGQLPEVSESDRTVVEAIQETIRAVEEAVARIKVLKEAEQLIDEAAERLESEEEK